MKVSKHLLLLFIFLAGTVAYGQEYRKNGYINRVQLSQLDADYVILRKAKSANDTYTERAGIDIISGDNKTSAKVKDINGATIQFTGTMISVLNFMAYNGWEYVRASNEIDAKDGLLFRKKK